MRYTLTFQEPQFHNLTEHLFGTPEVEAAAYLLCNTSVDEDETRLLVTDFFPVPDTDLELATKNELVIKQSSYLKAIQLADLEGKSFIFVHSHPPDHPDHSTQDDDEETDLFKTAYRRIHTDGAVHGSLVLSGRAAPSGRVWLEDGTTRPIERVRVIGNRATFFDKDQAAAFDLSSFDRQILAFGEETQNLLSRLTVGVVGLGGTGSAIAEQLTRLGIGKLLVCDPQDFEATNVNRVYGSSKTDHGKQKSAIAQRNVGHIGTGTQVVILEGDTFSQATVKKLSSCDFIFNCTDDEFGRAVASRLALYYLIPVFDMGVEIDSSEGIVRSVRGRVTTLLPGSPCVFCRGIVTSDIISAEVMHRNNPGEYARQRKQGYVPELAGTAPSVVMFTTSVASVAISEMLQRLTGFMGDDRTSTEIILRFDESKTSTNTKISRDGCWCTQSANWGRGDVDPLLDQTWGDA